MEVLNSWTSISNTAMTESQLKELDMRKQEDKYSNESAPCPPCAPDTGEAVRERTGNVSKMKSSLRQFAASIGFATCLLVFSMTSVNATHDSSGKRHSALQAFWSWSDLVDRWKSLDGELIDVKVVKFKSDNKHRYLGAWKLGNGKGGALYRYPSWPDFVKKWKKLDDQRLIDIDISKAGNTTWYTGIWQAGATSGALYSFNSWQSFTDKWEELKNQRLIDLEITGSGSNTNFTGVWRGAATSGALYRFNSWKSFTNKWKELNQKNQRLIDVEIDRQGSTTFYTGVWESGAGEYALYKYSSWPPLINKWLELDREGYYLVDIEAERFGDHEIYIGVWRK
jgi:ketosteroid isomerase-like protein